MPSAVKLRTDFSAAELPRLPSARRTISRLPGQTASTSMLLALSQLGTECFAWPELTKEQNETF
jgi:hypothetical protein